MYKKEAADIFLNSLLFAVLIMVIAILIVVFAMLIVELFIVMKDRFRSICECIGEKIMRPINQYRRKRAEGALLKVIDDVKPQLIKEMIEKPKIRVDETMGLTYISKDSEKVEFYTENKKKMDIGEEEDVDRWRDHVMKRFTRIQ